MAVALYLLISFFFISLLDELETSNCLCPIVLVIANTVVVLGGFFNAIHTSYLPC